VGLLQSLVPVVAGKVHGWIEAQRAEHLPEARPLTERERMALSAHFAEETLAQARVDVVERVPSPPFLGDLLKQLGFIGKRVHFNFSAAAGITFGECVLIVNPEARIDLLFHEMVHVEQYRMLGMKEFARAYVQGTVDSNFIYEKNPLEAIAFGMTARFTAGESVKVSAELPGWLREQGYS
jgi:AraC-like DNA-binding protein